MTRSLRLILNMLFVYVGCATLLGSFGFDTPLRISFANEDISNPAVAALTIFIGAFFVVTGVMRIVKLRRQ